MEVSRRHPCLDRIYRIVMDRKTQAESIQEGGRLQMQPLEKQLKQEEERTESVQKYGVLRLG